MSIPDNETALTMLLLLMFSSFKCTSAPMAAGKLSSLLFPAESASHVSLIFT